MRLIGSDYDGTLNHGGIDDAKRRAISRWRSCGNVFSVVSGRSVEDLIHLGDGEGFECDYYLAYNGALAVDPLGREVFSAKCAGDIIPGIIESLLGLGCEEFFIGYDKCLRFSSGSPEMSKLGDIPFFYQISTVCRDSEAAGVVTAALAERFGDRVNPLQNGRCIDIVRADINKAGGLCALGERLGISERDIIAVGDNVNDADMIARFRSYAMENAVDLIKSLADAVTPGIAELIEREL